MEPATTAASVLQVMLAHSASTYLTIANPGDTDGAPWFDDEAQLHDGRVALRRIRSNLRTFERLVDPGFASALRGEIAWLDERFGPARDLQLIRKTVEVSGGLVCRPHEVDHLVELASSDLEAVWSSIVEALATERASALSATLSDLCQGLAGRHGAEGTAATELRRLLKPTYRAVLDAGERARSRPTLHRLHQLRIRLKALRYGAEVAGVVDGVPAYRCAKAAENLQGRLGAVQDAAGAIAWLESVAREHPTLTESTTSLVRYERRAIRTATRAWQRDLGTVERRWKQWGSSTTGSRA
jgi:CHAD domain-containing protein